MYERSMKFVCEIDRSLPDTIRMSTEWRSSAKLSRYSEIIRDVRIVVRSSSGNVTSGRFECLIWVRLVSGDQVIMQENSEYVSDALTRAIDRVATAVAQHFLLQSGGTDSRRSLQESSVDGDL